MKARVMVALCLAALMLGACSASDPSEASENRAIGGPENSGFSVRLSD